MSETLKNVGNSGPYKVGLATFYAIAWLGLILFACCAFAAFYAHQYGPGWGFVALAALGVLILLTSGHLILDQYSIEHRCAFGIFVMHWADVRSIEEGGGAIILLGDGRRFVVFPPDSWSGREKTDARNLLTRQMQAINVIPSHSNTTYYKWHKNVRVRH